MDVLSDSSDKRCNSKRALNADFNFTAKAFRLSLFLKNKDKKVRFIFQMGFA